MKNLYSLLALLFVTVYPHAQTPFNRVYAILSTKCQSAACHSTTATDGSQSLLFDGGTETAVHNAIFNVTAANASSVAKGEKLVKPQHPYYSFLLRKIAGAAFDTDLAIDDINEGTIMNDINGQPLTVKEIEFIRQWIMFGAKKSYTNFEPKPDWQLISDYYDNPVNPFLSKPAKPAAGTGIQLRMGPVFLPTTGSTEQEWLEQQEVNFPYPVEIDKIVGYMNQQSHHFLLFKFNSVSAASSATSDRNGNMALVSLLAGNTAYDGEKILTCAWQDDDEMVLPAGTALFWDQQTVLDMNYHIKNYTQAGVLPCDFYFNVYYKPRNPNTIEMKSNLVNNTLLFLPGGGATTSRDYDDGANRDNAEVRYLWNLTSHAHKFAIDYDIYIRDTTGVVTDKIYEGFLDYANGEIDKGYYDWEHPSTRVWPDLFPVHYGKHNGNNSGLVARTQWTVTQTLPVTFGFTTNDEMQLFTYMYTNELPNPALSINDNTDKGIYFQVFPNPVNNNGKLIYSLDKAAMITAKVCDVTGKVIAELLKENQSEGLHEIVIGDNLSSGIYFATLSINGTVYTKKFIVTE